MYERRLRLPLFQVKGKKRGVNQGEGSLLFGFREFGRLSGVLHLALGNHPDFLFVCRDKVIAGGG